MAVGLAPVALNAWWSWRLWRAGLVRRYPFLFTYLLVTAGFVLGAPLAYMAGSDIYTWFWVICRPLTWLLFFLLILECYTLMVESYAAVRRIGQLVIYGALGGVGLVVAYLLIADPYGLSEPRQFLRMILVGEQGVYLAVAACALVLLGVQRFFRLQVRKNVRVVFATFGVYFSGAAALIVLRSMMGAEWNPVMNLGIGVLYAVCVGAGVWRFSPAGEAEEVDPRIESSAEYLQTLAFARQRLEQVNMELTKALAK